MCLKYKNNECTVKKYILRYFYTETSVDFTDLTSLNFSSCLSSHLVCHKQSSYFIC